MLVPDGRATRGAGRDTDRRRRLRGSYVARLLGKRGATIVSPDNFMLFTPFLPEAASRPLLTRKLRVVADWTTALFFRRDIAELSILGHPRRLE
jgi:hypothetical protein